MKLRIQYKSSAVKLLVIAEDNLIANSQQLSILSESRENDPQEIFTLRKYLDKGTLKVLGIEHMYRSLDSLIVSINQVLQGQPHLELEKILNEMGGLEELKKLLNNKALVTLEATLITKYNPLIKELASLQADIREIQKKEFSLDYKTPELTQLIARKNSLQEQFQLLEKEIKQLGEEFPEQDQLVSDLVTDIQKYLDELQPYNEELLENYIKDKNQWMQQSIKQEIQSYETLLVSAASRNTTDEKEILTKLRLVKNLTQLTSEQKAALFSFSTEMMEIKVKHIRDLNQLKLLTPNTLNLILDKKTLADKSCDARLNTQYDFFHQDAKKQASRDFWTLCSTAIEENISLKIQKKDALYSVLEYAASQRRAIARLRREDNDFGILRTEQVSGDNYSNDDQILTSVIANSSFVALADALSGQGLLTNSPKQIDLNSTISFGTHQIIPPPGKLDLIYDNANQLCAVRTEFEAPNTGKPKLNEALNQWQSYYLYNEKLTPDELLEGIGKLAFMLSRYYNYSRGTGSTSQWLIRGIVKEAFGIDLKDISLGAPLGQEKNGAPFDVYSHVCQEPNFYARKFCEKIGKVGFTPEYKKVLTGKELVHDVEEVIQRLSKSTDSRAPMKIAEIQQALERAKKYCSDTPHSVSDFLNYKENGKKSLAEALAIKLNRLDFIHTPDAFKDITNKFKSRYTETIKCEESSFTSRLKSN